MKLTWKWVGGGGEVNPSEGAHVSELRRYIPASVLLQILYETHAYQQHRFTPQVTRIQNTHSLGPPTSDYFSSTCRSPSPGKGSMKMLGERLFVYTTFTINHKFDQRFATRWYGTFFRSYHPVWGLDTHLRVCLFISKETTYVYYVHHFV